MSHSHAATHTDARRQAGLNLGSQPRRLVTQAGAFGEHRLDDCTITRHDLPGVTRSESLYSGPVRHLEIDLPPGAEAVVEASLLRHRATPSYETPWLSAEAFAAPIRSRAL